MRWILTLLMLFTAAPIFAGSMQIKAGTTDVSVYIYIMDSSDGTPETGVEHDTAGIDLAYWRVGSTATDITEAALASLDAAHSDGGIEAVGNGSGAYRLDLPDAAVADGADWVLVHGTITGMIVLPTWIHLVDYDPHDTVRMGMTALPNAAADAAGGLPISDAGALDLDGRLDVAVSSRLAPTVAARTLDVAATGEAGADFSNINGTLDDAEVADDVKVDVNTIETGDATDALDTALTSYDAVVPADLPTNFADLSISLTTGRVDVGSIEGGDATDALDTALTSYDAVVPADLPTNFADLSISLTTGRVDVGSIEGGDATDALDTAADTVTVTSIGADAITAPAIAAGAITASEAPNLDAAVSSRAPSATALTDATWTDARAGYLDALNGHTAQTGDSFARLGAPAGVSVSADIAAAQADLDDPGQYKADVSNLDATISSRSSHDAAAVVTAMETDGSKLDHLWETTEDDVGVRRFTTNALEQAPSGGGGGDATEANQTTIIGHLTDVKGTGFVKDTDSLVNLAHEGADGDTLETLSDQLDTAQTDLDLVTGTDGATLATAQGNYAPAKAGAAMDLVTDALDAAALGTSALAEFATVDTGQTTAAAGSVAKIAQGAAGGNVTVGAFTASALAEMVTTDTGETSATTGSVAQLAQGLGAGGIEWTYTLTSSVGGAPIADATVTVYTDEAMSNAIAQAVTDAAGQVTFYLDAGTYYLKRKKSGFTATNPDTVTVTE